MGLHACVAQERLIVFEYVSTVVLQSEGSHHIRSRCVGQETKLMFRGDFIHKKVDVSFVILKFRNHVSTCSIELHWSFINLFI